MRNSRIQVEILKRPSDLNTKFELFQRLNRGGETANAQEIRNCLCIMLDRPLFDLMKKLSRHESFLRLCQFTEIAKQQQRAIEWTMRTMVHTFVEYNGKRDVENFIDDGLKQLADTDKKIIERTFTGTFDLLREAGGDDALKPPAAEENLANRVTLRQIEAIVVGVSRNYSDIIKLPQPTDYVRSQLSEFWQQRKQIEQMSTHGLRGTQRLQRTIPFGTSWFSPHEKLAG